MKAVVDAAVAKAYGGARSIHWMEVYAGEKSTRLYGADVWLPDETLEALRDYVGLDQGPDDDARSAAASARSTSPCARSSTSTSASARCATSSGVPSPLKDPTKTDMVIFRENTEDIYAGIEWEAESEGARKADRVPPGRDGRAQDPLPGDLGDRDQAGLARGHGAARAPGAPVRDRQRAQLGDARAQGQHPEVHRGRLPRLGLRPRRARVRRAAARRRPLDDVREPEDRARDRRQGRDRRRLPAADPAAPGRVRRDRDD